VTRDSDIIARSLVEPDAFGELYLRHAEIVHRYAWRRAGEFVADEVTADTFLKAFESRVRFDSTIGDARPWLLGIATRLLHNHRRSEARRLKAFARAAEVGTIADHSLRTGERIDAVATATAAVRALRRMPSIDRDCLLLYLQGGLTYDEVATALDIPIGTVRSRLNRARTTLRRSIDATTNEQENDHGRANTLPHHA
jgi:RNA polymerase sigma factor (sigma-70 family)